MNARSEIVPMFSLTLCRLSRLSLSPVSIVEKGTTSVVGNNSTKGNGSRPVVLKTSLSIPGQMKGT